MPVINAGACVGVLYLNKASQVKVHNGKLVKPVNSDKLPNKVDIVHYTKMPTGQKTVKMKRETLQLTPLAIRKTPDYSPLSCRKAKKIKGLIESGACIAVRFADKNNKEDVKNGKFLYAIDQKGKPSCYINLKKLPKKIVYAHMNLVQDVFVPQLRERTKIREVRRITL